MTLLPHGASQPQQRSRADGARARILVWLRRP